MNVFSLRTLIDDILLIVRNNNISESEDLSRDQVRAWVIAYKAYLTKKQHDKDKDSEGDTPEDDSLSSTIGPLKLVQDNPSDECCSHVLRTKDKLPQLMGDSGSDIISVTLANGCVIQLMSQGRRHYHYYRRYTHHEPAYWFDNGYVYVEGGDPEELKYIYVCGNFADGDDENGDEDDVIIPGWMIPDIKKAIMDNELSFMLKRPSDDSNNSTLASVKPHGPQDQEQ